MAESLYVCQFSNGHIKVGRSVEPKARIASHVDRVSCMGVELSDHFIAECVGPAAPRENILILACAEAATSRFLNEWFTGLDFLSVCDWAGDAARCDLVARCAPVETFGERLREARKAKGITQAELGVGLRFDGSDMRKAGVSAWEVGTSSPSVPQLRAICERLGVSADWLIFARAPEVSV